MTQQSKLFATLEQTVNKVTALPINAERKAVLQVLIKYIQKKLNTNEAINLHFICTHNSRRSQFSQIWGQTAANYYGLPIKCFSGGVEVTAFNENAVASVERIGFRAVVNNANNGNPIYHVTTAEDAKPIVLFSKLYDDAANPTESFAAVMTCSHADENCPFIPGTEQRIPVRYNDPKAFDGTPEQNAQYDKCSHQIASEMFYVMSQIIK